MPRPTVNLRPRKNKQLQQIIKRALRVPLLVHPPLLPCRFLSESAAASGGFYDNTVLDFRLMNSKERIYGVINCVQNFYGYKILQLELRPILTFDGKMTLVNS